MTLEKARILKLVDVPKTVIPAGVATSMQMLLSPETTPNFAMRCFTIEAGGSMPNHTNSVEHEQYVLQGSAEVSLGGERHQVNAGDVVFIPAGMPHWYRTIGETPFQFLCLVPNEPDTIELVKD